jgi:hypothetical protein
VLYILFVPIPLFPAGSNPDVRVSQIVPAHPVYYLDHCSRAPRQIQTIKKGAYGAFFKQTATISLY